jgi:Ca2+-binding EF-hand superfamily protein
MSQLDKDGDGKLAKEELPEQAQALFDMMDTNADGFVDAQELAAVRRRMGGGGGEGGPGGPGGSPGGGGPGGGAGGGGGQ